MQRDLTKRYSVMFKKQLGRNPLALLVDLYRYGKLREFSSFIVWEAQHRLGLFPRSRYLAFNRPAAISLQARDNLHSPEFNERVVHYLRQQGLSAVPSSHPWKMIHLQPDGSLIGCLAPNDTDLYKSNDAGGTVVFLHRFGESIKSLFVSSQGVIFVNAKGTLHRSADGGASFEQVLDLGSSESFLRFNNAMTELPDGTLMAGEYGNVWLKSGWKKLAFIYISTDGGRTWSTSDFLIRRGANKHVHVVKYSPLLKRVVVADGDNYKRVWLSESLNPSALADSAWENLTRFHIQMGGYTTVVETGDRLFFGTDYQGGTNFMVESTDGRSFVKKVIPDPYRRSPIDNMVVRRSARGSEIWANLPFSAGSSKCLLMYSADNGRTWNKVFEYSRADHTVWLVSSSHEPTDHIYVSIADQKQNSRVVYRIGDAQ